MDREERKRLTGGILTGYAQAQRPKYSKDKENKCREGKMQMRYRRTERNAQHQRNAKERDKYPHCADALHA